MAFECVCERCETSFDVRFPSHKRAFCSRKCYGATFGEALIKRPFVEFNGERYFRDGQGWRASAQRGGERLHRAIWKHYNGEIPAGYCVTYADGNVDNNHPSNIGLRKRGSHINASEAGKSRWPRKLTKKLISLHGMGVSENNIAKLIGRTQASVSRKARALGLERRWNEGRRDRVNPKVVRPSITDGFKTKIG